MLNIKLAKWLLWRKAIDPLQMNWKIAIMRLVQRIMKRI